MFNEEQRKKGQSFILVNFIFFYFLDHVWGYSCNLLLMTAIEKVDQSLSQIQISGNSLIVRLLQVLLSKKFNS